MAEQRMAKLTSKADGFGQRQSLNRSSLSPSAADRLQVGKRRHHLCIARDSRATYRYEEYRLATLSGHFRNARRSPSLLATYNKINWQKGCGHLYRHLPLLTRLLLLYQTVTKQMTWGKTGHRWQPIRAALSWYVCILPGDYCEPEA